MIVSVPASSPPLSVFGASEAEGPRLALWPAESRSSGRDGRTGGTTTTGAPPFGSGPGVLAPSVGDDLHRTSGVPHDASRNGSEVTDQRVREAAATEHQQHAVLGSPHQRLGRWEVHDLHADGNLRMLGSWPG